MNYYFHLVLPSQRDFDIVILEEHCSLKFVHSFMGQMEPKVGLIELTIFDFIELRISILNLCFHSHNFIDSLVHSHKISSFM